MESSICTNFLLPSSLSIKIIPFIHFFKSHPLPRNPPLRLSKNSLGTLYKVSNELDSTEKKKLIGCATFELWIMCLVLTRRTAKSRPKEVESRSKLFTYQLPWRWRPVPRSSETLCRSLPAKTPIRRELWSTTVLLKMATTSMILINKRGPISTISMRYPSFLFRVLTASCCSRFQSLRSSRSLNSFGWMCDEALIQCENMLYNLFGF